MNTSENTVIHAAASTPARGTKWTYSATEIAASTAYAQIIFRPDPTIWDGRFANNGWLQELPKPLTKITWDPTAWISAKLAQEKGLRDGDLVELRYRGNTATLTMKGDARATSYEDGSQAAVGSAEITVTCGKIIRGDGSSIE